MLSASWIAGIWHFSSQAGSEVGLPAPWDKVAHFCSYALLGFLTSRALSRASWGWGIAALYGAVDEWHQSFVPMRDASVWDWIADALGAFVGSRVAVFQRQRSG
jgi:VanZ family protein